MGEDLMPYEVRYKDEATGYEWTASFETEEEALAQAAMDTHAYGGKPAQEVVDDADAVVQNHEAIVAEADKLDGSRIPE